MTDIKEAVRPTTLGEFCGQASLRRRLMPFIAEAMQTQKPLPHMLLTGPPGSGKTSLAAAIADEVGDQLHAVDFSRMTVPRMISFFRRFEGGIVLCDEVHTLSKAQQDMLLTLMEEGYVSTQGGGKIFVPWLTVIAATTNPEKLNDAFVARCALKLEYEDYTDDELIEIVRGMARKMSVDLDDDQAESLATAAGGVPRTARDLVMAFKSLGYTTDHPEVADAMDIVGVEKDGLKSIHLKYLRVLDALEGQAGERPIANLLGVPISSLFSVEKVLISRGLISLASVGRILTAAGDARLHGEKDTKPMRRVVAC